MADRTQQQWDTALTYKTKAQRLRFVQSLGPAGARQRLRRVLGVEIPETPSLTLAALRTPTRAQYWVTESLGIHRVYQLLVEALSLGPAAQPLQTFDTYPTAAVALAALANATDVTPVARSEILTALLYPDNGGIPWHATSTEFARFLDLLGHEAVLVALEQQDAQAVAAQSDRLAAFERIGYEVTDPRYEAYYDLAVADYLASPRTRAQLQAHSEELARGAAALYVRGVEGLAEEIWSVLIQMNEWAQRDGSYRQAGPRVNGTLEQFHGLTRKAFTNSRRASPMLDSKFFHTNWWDDDSELERIEEVLRGYRKTEDPLASDLAAVIRHTMFCYAWHHHQTARPSK